MQGDGPDWPITYEELAPYYQKVERFLGVSGPTYFPWGAFHGPYPQGELPLSAGDEVIARGFEKLHLRWCMAPHAVLTGVRMAAAHVCITGSVSMAVRVTLRVQP